MPAAAPAAGDAPTLGAPGRYTTASGRTIALVAYDGGVSHAVAFGGLLRDGRRLADVLSAHRAGDDEAADGALLALAIDGETYGHHHRFGDMALAAAIDQLERHPNVRLTNVAAYLDTHMSEHRVDIVAPSAWSCGHGVERWRADCGCCVEPGMHRRWKAPLREAIDGVVAEAHALFEREGASLFGDVWDARDRYEDGAGAFPPVTAADPPAAPDELRARALLEMERLALRAQTSVAWFFDDVVRPEPLIVLRAAARLIELAGTVDGDAARRMEHHLLERLARAHSNDATIRSARDFYLRDARPTRPPAVRIAAGFAAARRFASVGPATEGPGTEGTAAAGATAALEAGIPAGTPDGALPAGWSAAVDRHTVRLVERRTARAYTFDVLVDVPGPLAAPSADRSGAGQIEVAALGVEHPERGPAVRLADVDPRAITVLVRSLSDAARDRAPESAPLGIALKLADLTDRAQRTIERAVRRAVVHRLLDADERERLAAGETELGPLVSAALRRAVRALATDLSQPAIARVLGLIDLRASLRGVAPFDAQTLFHELRAAAPPDAAARLAPIARRLGFSTRAWDTAWRERPGTGDRGPGIDSVIATSSHAAPDTGSDFA